MLEALALDTKGESTVFGDTKTWTPAVAALLNGALQHLCRNILVLQIGDIGCERCGFKGHRVSSFWPAS
jgi:hypothetical protein